MISKREEIRNNEEEIMKINKRIVLLGDLEAEDIQNQIVSLKISDSQ